MPPEDALKAARSTIGSLEAIKDAVGDVGWESRLESIWQDVCHAFRALRRAPGFAGVAVLTLALGIGVNTLFSVVNGLLLRALPVRAPQQLVMLSTRHSIDEGLRRSRSSASRRPDSSDLKWAARSMSRFRSAPRRSS